MRLYNYKTGEYIREATENEIAISDYLEQKGHSEAVFEVEISGAMVSCFVR